MPDFVTSDGVRLHYEDTGDGTPLLCLAGLSRNARDFDYAMPYLTSARVIRMDYRGRGKSDWAGHSTYTIPREAQDAVELLDHLGLDKAAVLGTSRGGLIAMLLGAMIKDRLLGVCLNDIGPEISDAGLDVIKDYIGRDPVFKSHQEAAEARPGLMQGFANVPASRWLEEVQRHYIETDKGLKINYDPRLRDAVLEAGAQPVPDLWPLFDALGGIPLALIRGANSDLLTEATAEEMQCRRPDMLFANVPDRAHIPFLDESEAVMIISKFLEQVS